MFVIVNDCISQMYAFVHEHNYVIPNFALFFDLNKFLVFHCIKISCLWSVLQIC